MPYNLPCKKQYQYLPLKLNPLHPNEVKDILHKLINSPPTDFRSANEWFGTFHELSCSVSQAQTILELNISLNNKDPRLERKLEEFEQNILSQLLNCREKMMEIYLNSPFKYSMHTYDYDRIQKEIVARKKFSKPELSDLQIEENKIIRNYKKLTNNSYVDFQGKSTLLSSVIGKTHDLNPLVRKNAFFTYWQFMKNNEIKFEQVFNELLKNRREQALVAGCKSYTEIAFIELGRFDYGDKECSIFRHSILNQVVPMLTQISHGQCKSLQEETMTPWNQQIWPEITPQNPPCNGSMDQLIENMKKVTKEIHPLFGNLFEDMLKNNLIDILPRNGKSSGAFSVTFQESRSSFLFGNFSANTRDLFTFIHEFGHCLHGYAVTNINNILLRHPGFEFCELMSIGLELLTTPYLNRFWLNPEDAKKALKYQLFQMLQFWPFMAMIDEWQHELYSHEKFLNQKERNALWLQISKKYKPHVDWSSCQEFEELGWLSRPHIFTSPFYFIDYGIAQVGALQLWSQSKQNYSSTIENYIRGLTLGSQLALPSLYKEVNVKFDFSEKLLAKLCNEIYQEIFPN